MNRLARSCFLAAAAVLFAFPGHGQDVVGGVLTNFVNFGQIGGYTVINVDSPFNTAGQITSVAVRAATFGGASACAATDAIKVRVFRPNTGNAYELVAERGPFPYSAVGTFTLTLSPPITVKRGDVLGLALFGPGQCGVTGTYGSQYHLIQSNGDYTGGALGYVVDVPGSAMNFRASSSSANALVGTLPGVGVTAGAAGSSFNTTISVSNPGIYSTTVELSYRAIGAATGAPPVSAPITLPPNGAATLKFADVFPSVTGVGSVDVYASGSAPVVNARVYNDTGSGTNGFTEALIAPTSVSHDNDHLTLTIPPDLSAFRMNIGVRAFAAGAQLNCTVSNAAGTGVASMTRTVDPNATSLESLQSFFGNSAALSPGGSVQCFLQQGSAADAIMYATVTDNHTNDSALFMAERR